jgi:CDP-glucose 4,6-dehydratase
LRKRGLQIARHGKPGKNKMEYDLFDSAFKGKRVWLSGHTGFKGAWLAHWLTKLGAIVSGYSLAPSQYQPLFHWLELSKKIDSNFSDIREFKAVRNSILEFRPDFVFHLAAQSLVRISYSIPKETIETNSNGTVNVLESLKELSRPIVAIFITTDKCYRNNEWLHSYREVDSLGGEDPYSASKAMAELAIHSYRKSFFSDNSNVLIASARAGNVIGGGDFAQDRIVPDLVRAQTNGTPLAIRNPTSTRPWQHVLEPLSGYLSLAANLAKHTSDLTRSRLCGAFNFGPSLDSNRTVADLVAEFHKTWPGQSLPATEPDVRHEAKLLNLATDKAYHLLGWRPVWDFCETIKRTASWYLSQSQMSSPAGLVDEELKLYISAAQRANLPWSTPMI